MNHTLGFSISLDRTVLLLPISISISISKDIFNLNTELHLVLLARAPLYLIPLQTLTPFALSRKKYFAGAQRGAGGRHAVIV